MGTEFNVLSNHTIVKIIFYATFSLVFLLPIFSAWAQRDASPQQKKKGWFRIIMPWLLLLIFISELGLLGYRVVEYPWNTAAEPSQASIYREMSYLSSGIVLFGWANDYQLDLLSNLTGSISWLCWTVYAFNHKRSDTNWWKKLCKVIAYILMTMAIIGFAIHELQDLLVFVVLGFVIFILLKIAHVKPAKSITEESSPTIVGLHDEKATIESTSDMENPSRFMPYNDSSNEVQDNISEDVYVPKETKTIDVLPNVMSKEQEPLKQNVMHTEPNQIDYENESVKKPTGTNMMYCKHCGKLIEEDSLFCMYCGGKQ